MEPSNFSSFSSSSAFPNCRLRTAIVVAVVTGWLTFKNLTPVYIKSGHYGYGWPWRRVLTHHGEFTSPEGAAIATVVNVVACLAILLAVAILCERFIRFRRSRECS